MTSVLEIGCGTGQLAQAIRDALPGMGYCGFDFSEVAIQIARSRSPNMRFEIHDALMTDLYRSHDYDLVISTEFIAARVDPLHASAGLPVAAPLPIN